MAGELAVHGLVRLPEAAGKGKGSKRCSNFWRRPDWI